MRKRVKEIDVEALKREIERYTKIQKWIDEL